MPRRAMVPLLLVAGLGLLGGGLTACGSSTGSTTGGAAGDPGSLTAGPSSTGVTPTVEPPTAPVPTTPRGPASTVTGTVSHAAIEGSCLVLTADAGSGATRKYLLIGDGAALRGLVEGAKVSITGRPEAGLATACQTGTPFLVEQVAPASGSPT